MKPTTRAPALALAISGWLACGRDEAPPSSFASPDTAATAGAPAAPTPPEAPPPPTPPGEAHAPAALATEPLVLTELPALCRGACDNALAVTLAELPSDTSEEMRRDLQRAVARDCAGRCLQRASAESARCVARARTALELSACP